jgi:bifunctional non-homologous end joining protein LigD
MLCRVDRGKVRFWSRNGKDWTDKFLNVVEAVKSLPVKSAILDVEIVVVDAKGHSSFQKLQRSMGKSLIAGFVFEVFDLISHHRT